MPKWEVVGGADKGGILVRKGPEVSSPAEAERLATGSIVEQVVLNGGRIHYRLVSGKGPAEGWVTTRLPDKDLLVPAPESTGISWDQDAPDEPPMESVMDVPTEDTPLGSRWHLRCDGSRPPAEAPYARSLIDLSLEEISALPQFRGTLKNTMKIKEFRENVDKVRPGAHWGIRFPHNFDMLREAGAPWLTRAFHRAGTLPPDNRVVSLKVHELSTDSTAAESMGGQGMKGWLEVAYEKPHPMLHNDLFVKLPFPYTPQNERTKNSFNSMPDEPEIMVNRLFGPTLPFRIPKYYYGDISYETSNYILISEKIPYKTTSWLEGGKDMVLAPNEVEPRIVKFKDYEMPKDGKEQYVAAMRCLGRMAAEYHSGGLGPKEVLMHLFLRMPDSPLEGMGRKAFADAVRKPDGLAGVFQTPAEALASGVGDANRQSVVMASMFGSQMAEFVTNAPAIYPELQDRKYLKQWYMEAMEVAYYTWEIRLFNSLEASYMAMLHGNLAADNAWYWRNEEGTLEAGLLDFGGASHVNIASNFTMSWIMGEPAMLKDHWQDLLRAFVDGVRENNGPETIVYDELLVSVGLAFALSSPLVGGNVQQLFKMHKRAEWTTFKDRWDPVVNDRFLNRNYTCAIRTTILVWRSMNLYENFKEWRKANEHWFPKKAPFECPDIPSCIS